MSTKGAARTRTRSQATARSDVELVKAASHRLRGGIRAALADGAPCFDPSDKTLLKFHGIYQEEDRDQAAARRKAGLAPVYGFMVRVKLPAGSLTASQYLLLDELAGQLGPSGLRLTSRQDLQFHGVPKDRLQPLLAKLHEAGLTTWGSAGDVARNVIATAVPFSSRPYQAAQRLAAVLTDQLRADERPYRDVWDRGATPPPEGAQHEGREELYGETCLPRKFKIAICVPPHNDVDVLTNDLGFIAHAPGGELEGFTVVAGGGMGMSLGTPDTHPALAQPVFFVREDQAPAVARAVLTVFRDFGDRSDRKRARLRYLIEKRGLAWFRDEVASRVGSVAGPPKPFRLGSVGDLLGWTAQGDGRYAFVLRVEGGRLADREGAKCRSALRALVTRFRCPLRVTPNHNVVLRGIPPEDRAEFESLLRGHGLPPSPAETVARQLGLACVALPTCSFALAESERAFPAFMDGMDRLLRELGLDGEPILFRMTGCPNGCARPYVADFGLVGRGPGRYAIYVGGSHAGDRLARLAHAAVPLAELPARIRPFLEAFAREREPGETFSAWWGRARGDGSIVSPTQFHAECVAPEAPASRR